MTDNPFSADDKQVSPPDVNDNATMVTPPEVVANEPPKEDEAVVGTPEDVIYGLFYSHGGQVAGQEIEPGEPIGSLTLRFGIQPYQVAELVGRGVIALPEAEADRRMRDAAELKRLAESE